jgi:hypothetical protein
LYTRVAGLMRHRSSVVQSCAFFSLSLFLLHTHTHTHVRMHTHASTTLYNIYPDVVCFVSLIKACHMPRKVSPPNKFLMNWLVLNKLSIKLIVQSSTTLWYFWCWVNVMSQTIHTWCFCKAPEEPTQKVKLCYLLHS